MRAATSILEKKGGREKEKVPIMPGHTLQILLLPLFLLPLFLPLSRKLGSNFLFLPCGQKSNPPPSSLSFQVRAGQGKLEEFILKYGAKKPPPLASLILLWALKRSRKKRHRLKYVPPVINFPGPQQFVGKECCLKIQGEKVSKFRKDLISLSLVREIRGGCTDPIFI